MTDENRPGAIVRTYDRDISFASDVNSASMVAREEAKFKSACVLARQFPRDIDRVRVSILKECARPGFAEVGMYSLPRADKSIEGLSVHFANMLERQLGNLDVSVVVVSDEELRRTIEVTVIDLESNVREAQQATFSRTVERRGKKKNGKVEPPDGVIVGERLNSYGEKVYLVKATDEEMLIKQNAISSRIRRNKLLNCCPRDVLDEALTLVKKTKLAAVKADPDAARTKLIDAFASVGVMPDALKSYVLETYKVTLDRVKDENLADLRGIYNSVSEGRLTWDELIANAAGEKAVNKATGEVVSAPTVERKEKDMVPVTEPKTDEPAPAIGTDEHADWLLKKLAACKTNAEKMELAKHMNLIRAERKNELQNAFLRKAFP